MKADGDFTLIDFAQRGMAMLAERDPELYSMLEREHRRQQDSLVMIAASSMAHPSVLACGGTMTMNVTTEGYPGARFHAGCEVVDEIERLAIRRARDAFSAQYANVQPHSGSSANGIVMFSLLKPGDTILGLDLNAGGHLTHGSRASVTGRYFNAIGYGLDDAGLIDYEEVLRLAQEHRPKLLICGASAYPRTIDFGRFREIADEVGALVLADISHISGLVVAGEHPSPIDHAHFTTTSTYKQLYGPRGGLILMGKDSETLAPGGAETLSDLVQRGTFPYSQGTPDLTGITAKAGALALAMEPSFKQLAKLIVADAQALANACARRGYRVLTGGTDNHMVLIDILSSRGMTGLVAEKALESCNIVINKNRIQGDTKSVHVTSGIRLGTNTLALRGMGPETMEHCAEMMHTVLEAVEPGGDRDYSLDENCRVDVREAVRQLCRSHPPAGYLPAAGLEAVQAAQRS
jgi:glycine hydroxymethyltransferase